MISQELENNIWKKLRVPVMDNDMRWGSVMDMVKYALENRVHLKVYYQGNEEFEEEELTEQDWDDLNMVHYYD